MRVKLTPQRAPAPDRPLPWDIYNARGDAVLRKGMVPGDKRQLALLLAHGAFVDSADLESPAEAPPPPARPGDPLAVWEAMHTRLCALLERPDGDGSFPDKLKSLAAAILKWVEQDDDVALFAMMQLESTRYAIAHALQTAVFCAVYCKAREWPGVGRPALIQAALTMNIAMLDLQQQLGEQDGPPSAEQRTAIRSHPLRGRERLEQLGVRDEPWLRTVAEHHESSDGKGYPGGISDPLPSAELLNIADRYCAKLGRRKRRGALAADRAARDLLLLSAGRERRIVSAMIGVFGLYPPGTYVQLADGETAVVTGRGTDAEKPRVCVLAAADGTPLDPPLPRDCAQPGFAISAAVPEPDAAVRGDRARLLKALHAG